MKPGLPPPPPVRSQRVVFRNRDIPIVGTIWIPAGIASGKGHPAIVLSTPGSSVKEQIGANYASRLAAEGYVALAFDPSHQGESGGSPRDLEDPAVRVEDVSCAIDFLVALPFVDEGRIGILGLCTGGGYAARSAMAERRIRAVGLVVPVNIGRAFRRMQDDAGGWAATLDDAGAERSHAALLSFDAFHLAEELLVQPLAVIVAQRRESTLSFEDGEAVFRRAPNGKTFSVVHGAGHYDLYDEPAAVEEATTRLVAFYGQWLSA